jgi:hypothetical protein
LIHEYYCAILLLLAAACPSRGCAEVESHPFDIDTMLFMDWRDDHLADLPEVKARNSKLPTFLYAMPFTKNKVGFLEQLFRAQHGSTSSSSSSSNLAEQHRSVLLELCQAVGLV